jgi:hypothetical protein
VFRIITCPEWGAAPPKNPITVIPHKAPGIIFHHTASHLRQIDTPKDESFKEACQYARDIQSFHMGNSRGWNDSGHNFLVTRGGHILQGRWLTVSQIENKRMVISAHCPGFNDWIGIEHEHMSGEQPTKVQLDASAWLQAWIALQYGSTQALRVDPHKAHFATACPDNLVKFIPEVKAKAQALINVMAT